MPIYYNPQQGIFNPGALSQWTGTVFQMVLQTREYWVYLLFHLLLVALAIYYFEEREVDLKWEIIASMQYFMTFFITFYNESCYRRYMDQLYPMCSELVDRTVLFCHEMNVSMYHAGLRKHRILLTKYLLAMIFQFFMSATGGKLPKEGWRELIRRGLLRGHEATILARYPGSQGCLVIGSWVMFLVSDTLKHDHYWQSVKLGSKLYAREGARIQPQEGDGEGVEYQLKEGEEVVASGVPDEDGYVSVQLPVPGVVHIDMMHPSATDRGREGWRAQKLQTVHAYNRLGSHVTAIIKNCHNIGFVTAMPIPYTYYHLMNTTLVLNIVFLAILPAFHRTYGTLVFFGGAVLVTQGIKSISAALVDPFGQDDVDFPVPDFVNHAFDKTVCLLLACSSPEVRRLVMRRVVNVQDFQDKHLKRTLDPQVLYEGGDDEDVNKSAYKWSRMIATEDIPEEVNAVECLCESVMQLPGELNESKVNNSENDEDLTEAERLEKEARSKFDKAKADLNTAQGKKNHLLRDINNLKDELEELRDLLLRPVQAELPKRRFPADRRK